MRASGVGSADMHYFPLAEIPVTPVHRCVSQDPFSGSEQRSHHAGHHEGPTLLLCSPSGFILRLCTLPPTSPRSPAGTTLHCQFLTDYCAGHMA